MVAALSVLVVVTLSILVTRVATVALVLTGLSREAARFQARSAFTGVGYTTQESEQVMRHPVRRRIVLVLMLLGNAGIITTITSVVLGFVGDIPAGDAALRWSLLAIGLALLWVAARSRWLDRRMAPLIRKLLQRYTNLDTRDYARLLHLSDDFGVSELHIDPEDWVAGKSLASAELRREGIEVLGIERREGGYVGMPDGSTEIHSGDTLIVYGRNDTLAALDQRTSRAAGAGNGSSSRHSRNV